MVLVGIFALFKLAITLINYVVDPDKTKDASKNGTTIIKNIFVAIVLLAISSTAFGYLGKISDAIFTGSNGTSVIERLVFGERNNENIVPGQTEARSIVMRVRELFLSDNGKCDDDPGAYGCSYYIAVRDGNLLPNPINDTELRHNGFTYIPVVSWIAAIFLIIIFGRYCIDLGARMLKLLVLQIISPIPIIMYVDPKQKNRLTIFIKTYISIWSQVFIRILTVYLAYVVIELVGSGELLSGVNSDIRWIITGVLYIGIFTGASQIPKLIDDIIGTKLSSETKGMNFGSILGGIIGGAAGAFGGGIAGGMAGASAGGGFRKMATGILSGSASGLYNGAKAKSVKDAIFGVGKNVQQARSTAGKITTAGVGGFVTGKFNGATGYTSKVDKQLEKASNDISLHKNFEDAVYKQYAKSQNVDSIDELISNDSRVLAASEARRQFLENNNINSGNSGFNSSKAEELRIAMTNAENNYKYYNNEDINESIRRKSTYENALKAYNDYMATQHVTLNQDEYQNKLSELTQNINAARVRAKADYESKAFASLEKFDTKQIAEKFKRPEEIAKLTEVEKAYYQLTRGKKDIDIFDENGKIDHSKFKNSKKNAQEEEKIAKAAKESDKYKNANEFKRK